MMNRLLENAKVVARNQGRLGLSPGEKLEDGRVVLCAGACIAYSGLAMNEGMEAADSFLNRVSAGRYSKEMLAEELVRLGFDRQYSINVILENDRQSSNSRIVRFMTLQE